VEIQNDTIRAKLIQALNKAVTVENKKVFGIQENQNRISITALTPTATEIEAGHFLFEGKKIAWEAAGIKANQVEPTSGYHVPEGVMAICGEGIQADKSRKIIKAREAKSFLLTLAGLS
jgi:hypothetical protein